VRNVNTSDEVLISLIDESHLVEQQERAPLQPFIIFDSDETRVADLISDLVDALEVEDLSLENTLTITYPSTADYAAHIKEGNYVITKDIDGNWQQYEIVRVSKQYSQDEEVIEAYCEHAFYELIGDPVLNVNFSSVTADFALGIILSNTRWELGIIDDLGSRTMELVDRNPLNALTLSESAWDGELRFRVEISGTTITHRYVDLLSRRGSITGQRFEIGHNINSIEYEVDRSELRTALYGRGQGESIDSDTDEPERLTFVDEVWTTAGGDPADKPTDQDYVEDTAATALYGKPDGVGGKRPIFGVYESQAKTPETLLWETWNKLQNCNEPRVSIVADVIDLEQISGFEHEKARLGDTVQVKITNQNIAVEARILRIQRSRKDPTKTRVELGNYRPVGSTLLQELQERQRKIDARRAIHDRGDFFKKADDPEYVYSLDIGERSIRVIGETYFYWDGSGLFAVNPLDPNNYWRYDKDGPRLTKDGGVTWVHRFGLDEIVIGTDAVFKGMITSEALLRTLQDAWVGANLKVGGENPDFGRSYIEVMALNETESVGGYLYLESKEKNSYDKGPWTGLAGVLGSIEFDASPYTGDLGLLIQADAQSYGIEIAGPAILIEHRAWDYGLGDVVVKDLFRYYEAFSNHDIIIGDSGDSDMRINLAVPISSEVNFEDNVTFEVDIYTDDILPSASSSIGSSGSRYYSLYARYLDLQNNATVSGYVNSVNGYKANGTSGVSGTIQVVTTARINSITKDFEFRYRNLTFTSGIITAISSESAWVASGSALD